MGPRRRIELRERDGRAWLLVDGASRCSGADIAELLGAAERLGEKSPLALNRNATLVIRTSMIEAGPFLAALRPSADLDTELGSAFENEDCVSEPIFWTGNRLNRARWAWAMATPESLSFSARSFKWRIVPFEFAKGTPAVFSANAELDRGMLSGGLSSSVLYKEGVALECGKGDDDNVFPSWLEVTYGEGDPDVPIRRHLQRLHIALPVPFDESNPGQCPKCNDDVFSGSSFDFTAEPPVSRGVISEALARIFQPCRVHGRGELRVVFDGRRFAWKGGRWVPPGAKATRPFASGFYVTSV